MLDGDGIFNAKLGPMLVKWMLRVSAISLDLVADPEGVILILLFWLYYP